MNAFDLNDSVKQKLFDFKSKPLYECWLKKYLDYFLSSCQKEHSSLTVLKFLVSISENYAASSLWQAFSCLSKYFLVCLNINLDDNLLLKDFLKRLNKTYLPKKSAIFSRNEIDSFLTLSSNVVVNCAFVVGLFGLSRISEMCSLIFENVTKLDDSFQFFVPQSKTDQAKKGFTFCVVHPYAIHISKYWDLFSVENRTGRFFRILVNGKPSAKVIGKNSLSKIPYDVAVALSLPNPESYTGHCLRRTAATLLAESGVSKITLKLAGRWKSDTVCDGYIDDSKNSKINIANALATNNIVNTSSSSTTTISPKISKVINISNNTNSTFILHI